MSAFHSPPDVPWEDLPDPMNHETRGGWPHKHEPHFHEDEHGVLVRCYHKCPSWLKIILVSAAMNVFWEFVTFWPVHHFFTYMHWIR